MLDTETKRRIDTARDILVGKVPDPKSQVEQITIALIYKFMDDMDAEAEELGGKRRFFNGEFAKYGWAKLMSPAMGGHEVLNLYGEAITRMTENVGIPPLFRDIFKNAYLPYRDPETLKSFLKIIDDFEYDHSERLGDAFEYLLSVLGSQGDAGQFRTPRHIIDFMVQIIDPKKDDSVLDPACGTAGFLISAYKHIIKANSKDGRTGAALTPDERKTLTGNIKGYDISPDMVRLSLVNLYLHGFTDPHIAEYDTLTSEDNWNEYADIILANPPFMSPKGGIKPHKRFSVQAKRSEVLFVDYIAEHLTPNGRAAVIVPEGIIFQSQNAYKQLREMLIKNYLYAVVSLPAGVFNPYSGVKTSILLMDKALAKRCDSLLFVKVENDGFNLGAQRRKIDKNDLPESITALHNFHQSCLTGEEFNADLYSNVLKVEKEKIGENGEWNLSGERYRVASNPTSAKWPMVELGKVIHLDFGERITKNNKQGTKYPVYGGGGESFKTNEFNRVNEYVIARFAMSEHCVRYVAGQFWMMDSGGTFSIKQEYQAKLNKDFIGNILLSRQKNIFMCARGGAQKNLNKDHFYEFKIPLPPLKIQQEIVAEIEGYQKIIDGARSVVDNYKPQIQIDPEWEMVKLGEVLTLQRGHDLPKKNFVEGKYPVVGSNGIIGYHNEFKYFGPGVITGRSGTIGKVCYIEENYWPHNTSLFVKDFKGNNEKYILFLLESLDLKSLGERTAAVPSLDRNNAHKLNVYLPPIETQKQIVAQIEKEQSLVNSNKELITLFEQKIKDKIASVWGE